MGNSVISIYNQTEGAVDPNRVLNEVLYKTELKVSSTACIITLTDNTLHAVNIGDSGFVLIRGGEVVYQSPLKQHRFNCPYQLGYSNDSPTSAQELTVLVKLGDVIVAGSDGLFDNVHIIEIEELVEHGVEEDYIPQQLACSLAWFAHGCSTDRFSSSSFEIAAQKPEKEYMGGKVRRHHCHCRLYQTNGVLLLTTSPSLSFISDQWSGYNFLLQQQQLQQKNAHTIFNYV